MLNSFRRIQYLDQIKFSIWYKISTLILLLVVVGRCVHAQDSLPQVVSGKIERFVDFHSSFVASRNIDVWLPENYSDSEKYAVLYMNDGQMLFDPSQTNNNQAWNVDDVASVLMAENKVKNFIVVGIWNSGKTRYQDYFPQKPFESFSNLERDTVVARLQKAGRVTESFKAQSDNYLNFIVEELKPFIDQKYAVLKNRENTFIAGSSMGGLISIYAICEYPGVFGGAAGISTHWPAGFSLENNPAPGVFLNYLNKKLPNPKKHKIYFDCGDQALDALYPPIQRKVDDLMMAKGYTNANWLTKYFPGDDHSEISWSKRLNIPLRFLLGK